MKIAFDLDGTLDHVALRTLYSAAECHKDGEHTVYVLTGMLAPQPDRRERLSRLHSLDITGDINLIVCGATTVEEVARMKGEFCNNAAVDLFIDDQPVFIAKVRELSPNTVCLQVLA